MIQISRDLRLCEGPRQPKVKIWPGFQPEQPIEDLAISRWGPEEGPVRSGEAGSRGWSVEEHLQFALAEGGFIFTQHDDFLRIASSGKTDAGIVYAPQHTPIGRILQGLMLIHQILEAEEMAGNIEFL